MRYQNYRDLLIEKKIVTENEIDLVTEICGYTINVLNQILRAKTGYDTIEEYQEVES
jgi:hypothetical protein